MFNRINRLLCYISKKKDAKLSNGVASDVIENTKPEKLSNRVLIRLVKNEIRSSSWHDIYAIINVLKKEKKFLSYYKIVFLIAKAISNQKEAFYYVDDIIGVLITLYAEARQRKDIKIAQKTIKAIERIYDLNLATTSQIVSLKA